MAKVLGVDYGKKRIGLAVTDEQRLLVFPKDAVFVNNEKDALEALNAICKENKISLIVIGLPLLLDGRKTSQTKEVISFAKKLQDFTNLSVEFVDETLSTFEAEEMMEDFKKEKKKKNSGEKDILSAQIILKRWLDLW
ncbi:MAG: Holliday junction resolvase RuvX [Candidatus Woesearchaeota archaeon]|jgi:putative Holliday junction resolvase